MRNSFSGTRNSDVFQGFSSNHRLRVLKSSFVNSNASIFFVLIICWPIGNNSIPSAFTPFAIAANKAVPLPANGSRITPSTTLYFSNRYSTKEAENASLNLYHR